MILTVAEKSSNASFVREIMCGWVGEPIILAISHCPLLMDYHHVSLELGNLY